MRRTSIFAVFALTAVVAGLIFVSVEIAGAQIARDHRAPSVSRRAPNPGELAPQQDGKGPSVVYAGTSLRCGNTVYHVKVKGGSCGNQSAAMGSGKGCSNRSGDYASANCENGCGETKGEGADCTITVVQ